MKKDIHPKWYPDAEVVCDGDVVLRIGSTKPRISVDIWSGTHPFFTGESRLVDTEGQVDRFMRRLQMRQQYVQQQVHEEVRKNPRSFAVSAMGLDSRAANALVSAGYATVGDVLAALEESEDTLLAVQGVGQKALIDIRRYLRTEELID
jgi:large subunit ribosomal protein L31